MTFDAFISYSSRDKTAANATCAVLEGAGVRCWIAPRDISAGQQYGAAIVEAIDRCRVMVLVFSSSANESQHVHREIERAVSKGVPILPVRIENVVPTKSMEYFLGAIHWMDALNPPLEKHLQKLAETVKAMLEVNGQALHQPAGNGIGVKFPPDDMGGSTARKQPAPDPSPSVSVTYTSKERRAPNWLLLAIVGAALIALIPGGIWLYRGGGTAPGGSCAEERGAKSGAARSPTAIIFNNKTVAPLKIFWIDYSGERKLYAELAAGGNGRQQTFVDHLWVVADAQGGCLGLYRAETSERVVTIAR
jgi:hypothetical protein